MCIYTSFLIGQKLYLEFFYLNYFSLTTDNAGRTEVSYLSVSGWAYEVKLH